MSAVSKGAARDRVREVVASILEIDESSVDADALFYDDLSINSLEAVEIAARIKREFNVSLTSEEAAGMNSVMAVVAVLADKGVVR